MAACWTGQTRACWNPAGGENSHKDTSDGDYSVSARELIPSPNSYYEVIEFLGKGTFGQVLKCWKRDTNEVVALKILKSTPSYAKQGQVEVDILHKLSQVSSDEFNFVTAYESFTHCGHICIAFELLQINLYDYLKKSRFTPLPLHHIRPIAQQVLSCLAKLKEMGLVHADLKPENIMLVDPDRQPFRVKVIDFGSTTHRSHSNATTYLQSRYYRAPEVILGLPYDESIDMWSLGCVLVELYLGWPLFPGSCEYDQITYIIQMLGSPPAQLLKNVSKASRFFQRSGSGAMRQWTLKTRWQYEQETGITRSKEPRKFIFTSVADIIRINHHGNLGPDGAVVYMDQLQFVALLQQMLTFDPTQRISPNHALQHHYITMQHLSTHTNTVSVRNWIQSMQVCCQSRTTHSLSPPSPYTTPHQQHHPQPVGYHIAPSTFGYFPLSRIAIETALCHENSRPRQTWSDTDTGYVSADPSPATVISVDSTESAPLFFTTDASQLHTLTPAHPHYLLCQPPTLPHHTTELCYVLPPGYSAHQQAILHQEQLYNLAYHSRL